MNDNDKHIVEETDGWYFWDEVGMGKYGPYIDKEETRNMLHRYCKEVLENDLYWPSSK